MEYNLGSSRASNFKLDKRVAQGRFETMSTIIPELYDTKSYYQLILSVTKFEVRKSLRALLCEKVKGKFYPLYKR